jgi:hypothetical protein
VAQQRLLWLLEVAATLTACLAADPHGLQDKAVDNVGRFLWLPLELTLLLTWHLAEEVRRTGQRGLPASLQTARQPCIKLWCPFLCCCAGRQHQCIHASAAPLGAAARFHPTTPPWAPPR